jgi:hypothetical protein
MAGAAAAVARIADIRGRLEATTGGQLPGSEHVLPLVRSMAAPPPVAPVARIRAPGFIMLGAAIPRSAAGVAVGRNRATRPTARAAGMACVLELCGRRGQGCPCDPTSNHHQYDSQTVCALHAGCFGRRTGTASVGPATAAWSSSLPLSCPVCPFQQGFSARELKLGTPGALRPQFSVVSLIGVVHHQRGLYIFGRSVRLLRAETVSPCESLDTNAHASTDQPFSPPLGESQAAFFLAASAVFLAASAG